jgi:hypothetical protein
MRAYDEPFPAVPAIRPVARVLGFTLVLVRRSLQAAACWALLVVWADAADARMVLADPAARFRWVLVAGAVTAAAACAVDLLEALWHARAGRRSTAGRRPT